MATSIKSLHEKLRADSGSFQRLQQGTCLRRKKDVIFLEALKSDGIKIDKKYDDLYEVDNSEIPTDIQVMINNDELGVALLRLVEVIGQDELERIDEDTLYFIISTLNQLKIDFLRNKILLKVLPLKV